MSRLKITIFNSYAKVLLTWLNRALVREPHKALSATLVVVDKIHKIYLTRGVYECIKYTKRIRLSFINYILKIPLPKGNTFPKILRPYRRLIKNSFWEYPLIRLLLSSLYLTRALKTKVDISFKTIITPSPLSEVGDFDNLIKDLLLFAKDLGFNPRSLGRVPKSLLWHKYHMSAKKGPNGPALWTSHLDNRALPDSLRESIRIVGGEELGDLMDLNLQTSKDLQHIYDLVHPVKDKQNFRLLRAIPDKEGKTREIAIGDYWSQAALRPLHRKLYRILHSINQDCTHEQHKHLCFLKKTSESHSYHSIDLTAFSDRFPIIIQRELLRILFGREYAHAWYDIMVGYEFKSPVGALKYSVGNPMGMYSSWAIASLAHHFLIWKACKQANRNWRRCPYMLLGDDLVIADDNVAKEYKAILFEWNIPFSIEKTHTSKIGYEFAKQIIVNDMNVSPFPLAALYERRNSPIESVGIICQELWRKDWYPDLEKVIKDYYLIVLKWKYPKIRKYFPKVMITVILLEYLSGMSDLGPRLKVYVEDFTKMSLPLTDDQWTEFGSYIAYDTVKTLFKNSLEDIKYEEGTIPIGEVPQVFINNLINLYPDINKALKSQPVAEVSLDSSMAFAQLEKDPDSFAMFSSGANLRYFIGKVTTPIKDRDIYVRNRDVIIVQALKSSKIIRTSIADNLIPYIKGEIDMSHPLLM